VVVGTGASAAQIAPEVAKVAKHVTIMQRSKHWVLNNPDINTGVTEGIKFAMRNIPLYKEWFRFRVYWFTSDGLYGNVCQDDNWPDKSMSISAQNEGARQYALAYIHRKLDDRPDLLKKMVPDYPIFAKRIVLDADGGWLDTLKLPNVTLETRGIDHIDEHAVVLKDGTRIEADILALATGFDIARIIGPLKIHGKGGRDLGAEWGEDDPRAYLGVIAPGYPNFFFPLGPNSAPNHAAGVNMVIEAQINYIIETLDLMVAKGAHAVEPTIAAYQEWNDKVDHQMTKMIWTHPKAESYYLNHNRRNIVSCPFRLNDYWSWMRKPEENALTFS
jgi:4-hydroxyacetophenone monooxygenase